MAEDNHTGEEMHMHVGSFAGHIVPGSMFLIVGLLYSIQVYHQFFTCRKLNVRYKAAHARPLWFWTNKKTGYKQVEAIARLVLCVVGIIGEVATAYDAEHHMFVNKMMHAEHITMFGGFGISALVDILSYDGTLGCLPDGADYFCGTGAVLVEFILFLYHLHGRTMLNTHLHTILIYVIGLMALSTVAEFTFRDKVIWSIARPYFTWLQGTWFYQVAFILFNPANDSKPTLDVDDPESVMVVTLYFAGHVFLGFAVQFLAGLTVYLCHGRPQAKPHEYMKLNELSSGNSTTCNSSTTSTNRNDSDHENDGSWHETTNLINELS